MAHYAFCAPILPGKTADWKKRVAEMTGPRHAEFKASRDRAGLKERVWLQHTPQGDLAVVVWEAPDIAKVFQTLMTSTHPFDVWFRDKILVDIHGVAPGAAPPPMNEEVIVG
jgi:hypothetical protein